MHVRQDQFGRVFLEACDSDEKHFTQQPEVGEERCAPCRFYLDRFLEKHVGKKGYLLLTFDFEESE